MTLRAQMAGPYVLRILLFPDAALQKESPLPDVLRETRITVREAAASSARSFLTGFWPPQGAVAGVPAGFVVQVCMHLSKPAAPQHCNPEGLSSAVAQAAMTGIGGTSCLLGFFDAPLSCAAVIQFMQCAQHLELLAISKMHQMPSYSRICHAL